MLKRIELPNQVFFAENIAAAEVLPTWIKLYPAGYGSSILYSARCEMDAIENALKQAGFIRLGELMVNPQRLVLIEQAGTIWKLYLEGYYSYFPLRGDQLAACGDWLKATASPVVGEAETKPPRKKKGDA